ncbi:MAG: DUF1501 domain-containing protein [Planctomycetota bacterium]
MLANRRQILIGGARLAALAPFYSLASAGGGSTRGDRVLVVLQLTGGNDGLNTVVPHRQDEYFLLRPSLSLARGSLHAIDDEHGLHPELRGIAELFNEGDVAVVHGVGYPNPDRSHFRSMEIWHTADLDPTPDSTGWMGRLADGVARRAPGEMAALHIGDEGLPLALAGEDYFTPTVRDADGFRLAGGVASLPGVRTRLLEGPAKGDVAFLRDAARSTYRAAARMEAMTAARTAIDYPGTELGRRLRLVARLIAGSFGTRVFHVALDGFDTHAKQRLVHAELLSTVSDALSAFQRDLDATGAADRVATLVFSEFGRRARENGSAGTDHGAGAPLFVVGRGVRGGVYGTPPDLRRLEEGDVPATTDFRSVYAALERDWMDLAASSAAHDPLPLIG